MREGRFLSRSSPWNPSSPKRSCQRHTQVLDLPVRRKRSFVPRHRRPAARSRLPDVLVRRIAVMNQVVEPTNIGRRNRKRFSCAHSADSHTVLPEAIPSGIHMLGSIQSECVSSANAPEFCESKADFWFEIQELRTTTIRFSRQLYASARLRI